MDNIFPLLAVETSGQLCSAAVFLDENYFSEYNIRGKHIHSEKLLVIIREILSSLNISPKELKAIAISEGPGSFTGLRIGMAAVKGLALGAAIPIIPVPTFDAFAYKISYYLSAETKFIVADNVNNEELYYAGYKKNNESYELIESLKVVNRSDIENVNEMIFGNYLKTSVAENLYDSPSAVDIGIWAYKFGKDLLTSDYDFIEPRYLKDFKVRTKK